MVISPKRKVKLEESIILGQYLHYLRSIGYFDKVSVGGQGGSYAVNYWEDFRIPRFDKQVKEAVSKLYHSGAVLDKFYFSITELQKAGVFELNKFRIECNEILKFIVRDIKNGSTKTPDYYESVM